MKQIIHLEISSFRGISLGAIHYYGKLVGNTRIELEKTLTRRDAIKLNKHDDGYIWRPGTKYSGFDSEEEVIEFALNVWKKHFPSGIILIQGNSAVADPQLVIAGDRKIANTINKWYYQAEKINWYDGGQSELMHEISDAYWQFLKDNDLK